MLDTLKKLFVAGSPSPMSPEDIRKSLDNLANDLGVPKKSNVPVDPSAPRPTGLPSDPKKPNWTFYNKPMDMDFGALDTLKTPNYKPAILAAKELGNLVGLATYSEEVGIAETDQGYIDEKIARGELPEGYTGSTHLMSLDLSKNKPEATLSDLQQKKQELLDHQSKVVAMQDELTSSFTDGVKRPNMIGLNQALQNLNIPNDLEKVSNDLKDIDLLLGMNSGYQDVKVLTDIATNEKPPSLAPDVDQKVQKAAKVASDGVNDNQPPKTMLGLAGNMLGDIFSDPAVQQALVYYTGARLMGYSASGSGMAAGGILKAGWEQQAELEKQNGSLLKAAERDKRPDLTNTVEMWDARTRSIVSGHMAPNGDFYPSDESFPAGNARSLGLVNYKSSIHKTHADLNNDLVTYANKAVTNTLGALDSDKYKYKSDATNLFIDGGAVSEVVSLVAERFRGTGMDYGNASFRQSIERAIRSKVKDVAMNGPDDNDILVSDLTSGIESNFLKADLFNQGRVPSFVLEKVKWDGNKPGGVVDDYKVTDKNVSLLFKNASNLTNQIINQADQAYPDSKESTRSKVTNHKTIVNLAKVFKDTVMKDKDTAVYWQQLGEKTGSNAFIAWVNSGGSAAEQKYLGLNNPDVNKAIAQMYDASFK